MYTPLITDGSKKYGNNRWQSYSHKLKRDVYLFSDLEYEHWLLIESNPKVVEFCEQAFLMESFISGRSQKSIIDMWVKYEDDSEEFLEVKYTSDLTKEKVINQIELQKKWCEDNGFDHLVRTEKHIRANPLLLSNLKLLIKGTKQLNFVMKNDKDLIMKTLMKNFPEKIPIKALITVTHIPLNRLLVLLGNMILQGDILSDIAKQYFGVNTEVWINVKKTF